jgi:2-polyprenyl-3-methyl-5-hydroxy-6-metoxy-1,4-benzoquinol methylase
MLRQKILYLIRSTFNVGQKKQCPNCSHTVFDCIDTKYLVTRLYKCKACKLNFRFPVDSKAFLDKFYQSEYQANYSDVSREITDLPDDEELTRLMQNNFYGKRDYSPFVKALLKTNSAKILDYGCSWGYSIFQLKQAGYDSEGFEISKARANFGEKIGIKIHHEQNDIRDGNDLIMSSHAIEHLPVVSEFIRFAASKLVPDGILMTFCPNGSPEFRNREPHNFHVNWGFLHPNYLDVEFAAHTFRKNPYLILTDDWRYNLEVLEKWDGTSQIIGQKLDGQELLVIAKPNVTIL